MHTVCRTHETRSIKKGQSVRTSPSNKAIGTHMVAAVRPIANVFSLQVRFVPYDDGTNTIVLSAKRRSRPLWLRLLEATLQEG